MTVATNTIEAPPAQTSRLAAFWRSWIGRKALMAVTGLVLAAYVLVHMAGNLQVLSGAEALDAYARGLRRFPALLWSVRAVLLLSALVHVVAGFQLWMERQRARVVSYREYHPAGSSAASRTMIWSGFLILGFVVYHLLDLTFGVVNPQFREGEVFHNLTLSLARGGAAAFYIVAVAGLGVHLWHGFWSAFQSLGFANRAFTPGIKRAAALFATVVAVGFAAVPLGVLLGIVR